MIQGTSAASTTTTTNTTATTNSNSVMGKDSFLKLLLAQLKNQDPLKPMESTDFTAQLAQFTQIESLTDIKDLLKSSATSESNLANTITSTLAVGLIGKDVSINSTSLNFDGTNAVKFSFDAPDSAVTLGVAIYDSSGNLVKNLDMTSFTTGTNSVSWNGKDADGNTVAKGDYVVGVSYKDKSGTAYNLETYISGKITGLKYKSGVTYVVVGGNEISFDKLREILGGTNAGG